MKFKRALVSVSDKTGLVDLLRPLVAEGLEIVSTGGTARFLREHAFQVTDVSTITQFPEVMDGRVKTLHPKIHMALLARADQNSHLETLSKYGVAPFDLVVVNLYPFEKALENKAIEEELIENIDIGGPSMLRSSAKNFKSVAVLCRPEDYSWFLAEKINWSVEKSKELAVKVFTLTARYDAMIAQGLHQEASEGQPSLQPQLKLSGQPVQELRYGENPQQKATWYIKNNSHAGLHQAQILQGKSLSYNNLLDLDAAVNLVKTWSLSSCVAVKHNNPCGVGQDQDLNLAIDKAMLADPVSVFGGIVACNAHIDEACANKLSAFFLECIIAPGYSSQALEIFSRKKNLRILCWPEMLTFAELEEFRSISGGFLVQDKDSSFGNKKLWSISGEEPNAQVINDVFFGEAIVASLKSNAIAIVRGQQTKGLGMGQVNRVDAVEQAIARMHKHHALTTRELKSTVLVSDAFFPFEDAIDLIAKNQIGWIAQPGGSIKDKQVIEAAQKNRINMILTQTRHFRH
jgi:phosphoribosylaminoimidazolecarboxamide formyltransferase / IMP cyclohydrolase